MSINLNLPVVAFVGGGNMAAAMIGGLIQKGQNPKDIIVVEPSDERAHYLQEAFHVITTKQSREAVTQADVIVLAVKPQVIEIVAKEIQENQLTQGKVFISIAAGTTVKTLESHLGNETAIVRLMPNMPALVGAGISGLYANQRTSQQQKAYSIEVSNSCGQTVQVEHESDINIVTGLSGSGPAYFLRVMEGMIEAGQELGFSYEDALKLVAQTAMGAGQLALEASVTPTELRQQITSKRGTTEAGLNVLNEFNVKEAASKAVKAAHARAIELGEN